MTERADLAAEAFLRRARADLQRHVGISARVDDLTLEERQGVVLRAELTVAQEHLVVTGRGPTLVEAYADLIASTSPSVLESAYRQVLGDPA